MFWDSQGVLLAHFQKCGENVNSASYHEVLLKLQDVQANWQEGHCFIMTMPDPMQPEQPRKGFKSQEWELLEDRLTYSPDLAS
jgi:hypothetical protein